MNEPDPNQDLGFALRAAAIEGDLDTMRALLAAGASVDALDQAPIRWAVRHRQTASVKLLLESGADLEWSADQLLIQAAGNGDATTLDCLLSSLPHPYTHEILDKALIEAAKSHDCPTVRRLLTAGANPNVNNAEPLHSAACFGDVPVLKTLIEAGGDVQANDSQCLFAAVFGKHPRAVRFLLEAGADIRAQNGIPLQLAITHGDAEIVETLFRAGMPFGDPAWVVHAANTDSVETLMVVARYTPGWTQYVDDLIVSASEHGCPRLLAYVLKYSPEGNQGPLNCALVPAVRAGSTEAVLLLLAYGANPTSRGSAALALALESGQLYMARELFNAGAKAADLPATAFIQAYEHGDPALALDLLHQGINLDGAQYTKSTAARLCTDLPPKALFYDGTGNVHTRDICESRLRFAKALATEAAKHETGKVVPTIWLSRVLETRPLNLT